MRQKPDDAPNKSIHALGGAIGSKKSLGIILLVAFVIGSCFIAVRRYNRVRMDGVIQALDASKLSDGDEVLMFSEAVNNLFGTSNQTNYRARWLIATDDPKRLMEYVNGRQEMYRSKDIELSAMPLGQTPVELLKRWFLSSEHLVLVEGLYSRGNKWWEIFD